THTHTHTQTQTYTHRHTHTHTHRLPQKSPKSPTLFYTWRAPPHPNITHTHTHTQTQTYTHRHTHTHTHRLAHKSPKSPTLLYTWAARPILSENYYPVIRAEIYLKLDIVSRRDGVFIMVLPRTGAGGEVGEME